MDIPYTQQLSPKQTPLRQLLNILRQNEGNKEKLRKAVASAFYKTTKSPYKIAGNTMIALRAHGIIDNKAGLTPFGKALIDLKPNDAAVALAKNILRNLGGFQVVEALREMRAGGHKLSLVGLTDELKQRGLSVSSNSSDLSGVCGWLEEAGVLKGWEVVEDRYGEVMGTSTRTVTALKEFNAAQIAFARAMVALNVMDFTPYIPIVKHAELLYPGQVTFNWKMLENEIVKPFEQAGLIEVHRASKSTAGARGGKPAEVKPTEKFQKEVADPILESLMKNAGMSDLRKIRSIPLAKLVADIKQNADINLKGESLEVLAIRICQLLDLEFMGWRQTDEALTAGGEVDGMMHSARLIYRRWQIQCKATDKITYEMLAKEFGVAAVTLASVILVVSTGQLTEGAVRYREFVTQKTALHLAVIDGQALDEIVKDPAAIGQILATQALTAMRLKQQLIQLEKNPPSKAPAAPVPAVKSASEKSAPEQADVKLNQQVLPLQTSPPSSAASS